MWWPPEAHSMEFVLIPQIPRLYRTPTSRADFNWAGHYYSYSSKNFFHMYFFYLALCPNCDRAYFSVQCSVSTSTVINWLSFLYQLVILHSYFLRLVRYLCPKSQNIIYGPCLPIGIQSSGNPASRRAERSAYLNA